MSDPVEPGSTPAHAGPEFAAFVQEQLEVEGKRRASLEARSLAVITTSGTLVTLALGLAALITQRKDFKLPGGVTLWLIIALTAFVVAAALGIAANAPQLHYTVDTDRFAQIIRERWSSSGDDALKTITATRLSDLRRSQSVNSVKGWLLLGAVTTQGIAISALTIAVALILSR